MSIGKAPVHRSRAKEERSLAVRAHSDLPTLLGPPALLNGEDRESYKAFARLVSDSVRPSDSLEEMFVRDVVDWSWEITRLRRIKVALMTSAMAHELREALGELMDTPELDGIVKRWRHQEGDSVAKVRKALWRLGLTEDSISAKALIGNLEDLEALDTMIMRAEGRRGALLGEVERRRESLARRLRELPDPIQDADFKEVESLPS